MNLLKIKNWEIGQKIFAEMHDIFESAVKAWDHF